MPQIAQVKSRRAISANIHLADNIGLAAIVGDRKCRLPALLRKPAFYVGSNLGKSGGIWLWLYDATIMD